MLFLKLVSRFNLMYKLWYFFLHFSHQALRILAQNTGNQNHWLKALGKLAHLRGKLAHFAKNFPKNPTDSATTWTYWLKTLVQLAHFKLPKKSHRWRHHVHLLAQSPWKVGSPSGKIGSLRSKLPQKSHRWRHHGHLLAQNQRKVGSPSGKVGSPQLKTSKNIRQMASPPRKSPEITNKLPPKPHRWRHQPHFLAQNPSAIARFPRKYPKN